MVDESATLKNQDLPGMTGPMSLGQPPLSLDLHYLVTADGPDPDDDRGASTRARRRDAHPARPPDRREGRPPVRPRPPERGRAPQGHHRAADVERLTNLWTAITSPLRVSVGYRVTVVQLESTQPRSVPKPVIEPPPAGPRVYAVSINRPVIADLGVMRRLPRPHSRGAASSLRPGRGAAARGGFGLVRWDQTDSR